MRRKMYLLFLSCLLAMNTGCGSSGPTSAVQEESHVISEESTAREENAASEEMKGEKDGASDENEQGQQEERRNLGYEELLPEKVDLSMLESMPNEEEALKNFTYGMFDAVKDEKNPLVSPLSVYFVLSMAGVGARGETAEEYEQLLGNEYALASKILMEELMNRGTEKYQLSIANSIWADDQLLVEKEYKDFITDNFQSGFKQQNLADQKTMLEINDWCKENTHGMIPSILNEPLPEEARMALLNAVYMKAEWVTPFSAEGTHEAVFHKEDGTESAMKLMSNIDTKQKYVETSYAEGVVLPYEDSNLVFVALKPKNEQDVRKCFSKLKEEDLSRILEEGNRIQMNLFLPKFDMAARLQLAEIVSGMGLEKTFLPGEADFSGIGKDEQGDPLYASQIVQEVRMKVDEVGTEASAVTMMTMLKATAIMREEPLDLRFDSPFVYMIVHEETGTPLFIGIMDEPGMPE